VQEICSAKKLVAIFDQIKSSDLSKMGKTSALNNSAQEPFNLDRNDSKSWVSTPNKVCWGSVFLYMPDNNIL